MSRSVLVVEDYPDLRAAIALALGRNGCVCDCVDHAGALTKLRNQKYEMVFIAPQLPIQSDPVMQYLESEESAGRVIVMTNPNAGDTPSHARLSVLEKPFSRDELIAQIG